MAAWFAKGAPCSEKTLGSYEECTAITGGVLEFLEVADFLANLGDSAHSLGIRPSPSYHDSRPQLAFIQRNSP